MLEDFIKNREKKRLLSAAYVTLLLIAVGIPYLFRHQLPGAWTNWTILSLCLVSLVITFAQIIYYAVRRT